MVALSGAALADGPKPSIWEGAYLGVHGGYGWATNEVDINGARDEVNSSGGFGGLQLGYNYHISRNWIVGYEVDLSFGSQSGRAAVGGSPVTSELGIFGTARTRVGYVQGPMLLYATGGLGWANTDVDVVGDFSMERPHVGMALGAGVEYAIMGNWSAKLEYLYMGLDSTRSTFDTDTIKTDLSFSSVRLGLNYHFANSGRDSGARFEGSGSAARWTGPYIGLHAGYAFGNVEATVNGTRVSDLDLGHGFGGTQSGYNWAISPNWLLGVESDLSFGSIHTTDGDAGIKIDMMGSVRGRVGFAAADRLLIYGTGGLAVAHMDSQILVAPDLNYDRFYLGWTAGVGAEYMFASKWSAKLEYLHSDFGSLTDDTTTSTFKEQLNVDAVRLGINYRGSALDLLSGR